MKYNDECRLCLLYAGAQTVCMPGTGVKPARIMVIGEAPGEKEDDKGEPFVGPSGKLLDKLLSEVGLDREKMFVTNAVKCRPPENRSPGPKEVRACSEYLKNEILEVEPEYVLLFGATALKAALKGKPKITEMHGQVIEKDGRKYVPMFHPAFALRDPKRMGPLKADLEKFSQLVRGIKPKKPKLNLELITHSRDFPRLIKAIHQAADVIWDTETTGLDRFEPDGCINWLGFETGGTQWIVPMGYESQIPYLDQKDLMERAQAALEGKEVVAQNGKFDNLWGHSQYGVRFPLTFDTMLASHLLDENDQHGLKYLVRTKLNGHDYDVDLATKTGRGPEAVEYLGYDLYYTRKLYEYQTEQLSLDEALERLFHMIVMPAARAYEQVEINGFYVNVDQLHKVDEELTEHHAKIQSKLNDYLEDPINWNSTKQVNHALFKELELEVYGKTPKGEPSTAEGFLLRMRDQHPIILDLLEYRGVEKLKGTYVDGWHKRLKNDCYLHPGFKLHGTVTGRPACSDPNMQATPRVKLIRSMVDAEDGWVHFEADYSQIELRVAAMLANERTMLQIFQTGGDIHRSTASAVSGMAEHKVTDDDRKKAKAVNFGFIYGMGHKKFVDYAFEKYGVVLNERQAYRFRESFFGKYYDLEAWHDRQRKIVHAVGQVRTLTGRIRHLPEIHSPDRSLMSQAERNAINSPVQGFAAEMTLMAMVELSRSYSTDVLRIAGTVHDAIVGRVKRTSAQRVLRGIKRIMEDPELIRTLHIDITVPIVVDVKVGPWGVGEKAKLEFTYGDD